MRRITATGVPLGMLGSPCSETVKGKGTARAEGIRSTTIKCPNSAYRPFFDSYQSGHSARLGGPDRPRTDAAPIQKGWEIDPRA